MAYQYRFVDVLARGLENAANRAERAEAARVQQDQFKTEMGQRKREFDALQTLREKADERAELAQQEETKYKKLNYELQVDKAIQDMLQFDIEQDNAMEGLKMRLDNALDVAMIRQGEGAGQNMIDVALLPPGLRDSLDLPEGTTQVPERLLAIYNTQLTQVNRLASQTPESLADLTDNDLQDILAFNETVMGKPQMAIGMGYKPDDIVAAGRNQNLIRAEIRRREEAAAKAEEEARGPAGRFPNWDR
jgi:hypothetical protein